MKEVRYSLPQEYMITSTMDVNLFLAGIGSGKTHVIGTISGYFIQNYPRAFGFIGANTHEQLTTSTLYRVREVWLELFGWIEGIDYVVGIKPPRHFNTEYHNFDKYDSIISFKWGAIVFKGSLDNAKAHDGKEFAWAFLDETKDTKEEAVKDVILTRLRKAGIYVNDETGTVSDIAEENGVKLRAWNPLYILTSPAKVSWINEWFKLDDYQQEIFAKIYSKEDFFVKETGDKLIIISSTYHNEANLPVGFIDRQIRNRSKESAKRLIYGNPFVKAGGEFYGMFDRMKHVRDIEYKPELPIHISFDQNVVPYITATLYQTWVENGRQVINQFDEICLPHPNNKTSKLCLKIIAKYGKHKAGIYYYGDPSGKKSDTRGGEHDYDIIKRIFSKMPGWLTNNSNRVPYKHPPVLQRKDFINNIFEGLYEVDIYIHSRCKNSISDFEYLKEDINGKKLKETAKGENGVTYEKYGHTSDSFDYFITKILEALFRREFK